MAGRKDTDLWFEDECHFQQHGSRCLMWVPPEEKDPVLFHAPTRKSVAVFGAVCVRDGRLVAAVVESFNTMTFQLFLKQLIRHRRSGRKIVLVLDNACWHHAAALKEWLHAHRRMIRLDFLPPYSPELNGMERVWKLTRYTCTHNRYFPILDELVRTVLDQFARWRRPNTVLRRLCAIN